MEEKIKERIEQLTKEREEFIAQANGQVSCYNAAIGELTNLLAPEPANQKHPEPQPVGEQAGEGVGKGA